MSRPKIQIIKQNEVWMKILCEEVYQEMDLQDRFSFMVPNAKHDPRVKRGVWDGIKKLYDRRRKRMYLGLLLKVLEFCEDKGWDVDLDPSLLPDSETIDTSDIQHLCDTLIKPHSKGSPITPHQYQLDAVEYMLNMDRTVCLSATSSGKSLMIYLAVRIYQMMDELDDGSIFIVVPSLNLVEQMYSDFQDYSEFNGSEWNVSTNVQKISGKYSKFVEKKIIITTWQSMKSLPHDELQRIDAIFCDEAHGVKADVLSGLLESLEKCEIRHGLTGTLDGFECNELVIQGLLGPSKRIVNAKEIMDSGAASVIKIDMVLFNYPKPVIEEFINRSMSYPFDQKYNAEIDFLYGNSERSQLILNMIESLKGNTLVLFDKVEKYGEPLYQKYLEKHPDDTFLITGDVEGSERESIRNDIEEFDNCTIFASLGTMSTGVSIKKLHNIVVISSSKSKIRVLQSIGRLMRKHVTKDFGKIYEIVDNLTYEGKQNYCMKHATKRLEYYTKEQFEVNFIQLDL